jgi:hypothetical protein
LVLADQRPKPPDQLLAGLRRRDGPRGSFDETYAKPGLELADDPADTGGRYVQLLRGTSKIPLLDNGDQCPRFVKSRIGHSFPHLSTTWIIIRTLEITANRLA